MKPLTFALRVDLENDTFSGDSAGPELARILRELADRIELHERRHMTGWAPGVRDVNGNTCGEAEFRGQS